MARFRRYLALVTCEFRLFRAAGPIHLVALVQPSLMYALMTFILVTPTFDVVVSQPTAPEGIALVQAMYSVGSPIGDAYISPQVVDQPDQGSSVQKVTVETIDGVPTATQRFALVDSNQVKNYRNRLTAAALRLWNDRLGNRAVTIREYPWLPRDVPYTVYFGMALIPMAAFLAASLIGAVLTAQDFEWGTVLEYRLSPAPPHLVLSARLTRLALTGLVSAGLLGITIGLVTGYWPHQPFLATVTVVPVAVLGACLGVTAGLVLRRTIPAFLVALAASLFLWLMGGAFGLPAGFSSLYRMLASLSPNTYAVQLLVPRYYPVELASAAGSISALTVAMIGAVALTALLHSRAVSASRGVR